MVDAYVLTDGGWDAGRDAGPSDAGWDAGPPPCEPRCVAGAPECYHPGRSDCPEVHCSIRTSVVCCTPSSVDGGQPGCSREGIGCAAASGSLIAPARCLE